MTVNEAKQVVNLIRTDSDLRRSDRLHLLKLFDDRFTVRELSEIFNISERQVFRDRQELEKGSLEAFKDMSVPVEALKHYIRITSRYKDAEKIEGEEAKILATKRIADTARPYLEIILKLKVHEYLESKEKLDVRLDERRLSPN